MLVNSRNQVKILLTYEGIKLKELAVLMSEKSGKHFTPDGLSHKINRGRLTYDEMLIITECLGYDINFTRKKDID